MNATLTPGEEFYNPHESEFRSAPILQMVQIPQSQTPSHQLFLTCALLTNSGGGVPAFPA